MPQKIKRRGPSVFHKKKTGPLKVAVWVVLCGILVTVGFFSAKYLTEHAGPPVEGGEPASTTTTTGEGASPTGADPTEPTSTTTEPSAVSPGQPASTADGKGIHAFYLPVSALKQTAALDALLDEAAAAGFNAAVFDLKDENGVLHYASQTEDALTAGAAAEDAFRLEELQVLIQHMKDRGVTPIPRLYAFKDRTAPSGLTSARIGIKGEPGWMWLDNSKDAGGKPWLNPYSTDAHRYITGLAQELKTAGFDTLLLDGVQFPNQTSQAYYGAGELTSLSKDAVLAKFVTDLTAAVNGDGSCTVMLSMPGLSAFSDETAPFGGNPLTFGAAGMCPNLSPATLGNTLNFGDEKLNSPATLPYDAVRLSMKQIDLRLKLLQDARVPFVCPWLQAYDYSTAQIKEELRALTEENSEASYILYNSGGTYDFAGLK
jgi:hypothetical protein